MARDNEIKPPGKPGAKTVEIGSEHAGQRIDNYLMSQLKGVPRSHIYRLLRSGQVRVNSGRKKPPYKLRSGDMVRIPPVNTASREPPVIPDSVRKLLSEAILFENENILVLNKPSGLAVHSGSGLSFGIIEALKADRPDQFLELAHRLDRETSGCLLLAKNRATLTHLHGLLRNETESGPRKSGMGKYYLTLVAGHWADATTIDLPLKKIMRSGEHMVEVVEDGQQAISHFEPLQYFKQATLMRVKIDTGRTHQIRVHAAHAGHPIAGDGKYGDADFNRELKKPGLKRLFLHAARLEIPALESGLDAPIIIEAPLNRELQEVLDALIQT
jgi:23S rRNA pseudouridine955/2504/2580 synthase